MRRHHQPHIDRCFDIDEHTSDTSQPQPQVNAHPPDRDKRVDAHRLDAVSVGGGWWNPTTRELLPILPPDHPDYRENADRVRAAIRRWNGESK